MRYLFSYLPLFFSLLMLQSCGASFKAYDQSAQREQAIFQNVRDESSMELDSQTGFDERKIVYSAFMDMEVREPDTIAEQIMAVAKSYKGYVASTGTQRVVIRVPSSQFEQAMEDVIRLGKVERKTVKGEDVTEEYLDLGIRLDNAEKARARYLDLLENAENVGEALLVEKELERLVKEIDVLKGKINRLSNLTAFATISVNFIDLREQPKPGPLGYIFVGIYKGIKWLFVRN